MTTMILLRKLRRSMACAAAILTASTVFGLSHADQTNILPNTQVTPDPVCLSANPSYPETCLPASWFTEKSSSISLTYAYGTDSDNQAYIDVNIANSGGGGFLNLYFQRPVVNIAQGATYTVSATARMVSGSTSASARISAYVPNNQIGQPGAAVQPLGSIDSRLSYTYQSGILVNGQLPTMLRPMIGFWGVAANSNLTVRIKAPSLTSDPPITNVNILPLTYTTLAVAPGKVIKLTVNLLSRPLTLPTGAASVTSLLALFDAQGNRVREFVKKPGTTFGPIPTFGPYAWGAKTDPWQWTLPSDLPAAAYSIRWELAYLTASGVVISSQRPQLVAGPGVATVPPLGASGYATYEIGTLTVDPAAGIYVGQHFHRTPGNSSGDSANRTGERVLVPYHFVRTHDNGAAGGTQWWMGSKTLCEQQTPGQCAALSDYAWSDFDAFANYHSPTGQKKLLITFFGSPRWASARPGEASAYCDASNVSRCGGLFAEPSPALLAAYRQMVIDTVTRYRDKTFGVECWNEPAFDTNGNAASNSFFSGTPTKLADICKAIYTATKSVDATIPVYCPQAPSPAWLSSVLTARTSQNEPIYQFCDVVGAHVYSAYGTDTSGKAYSASQLGEAVAQMRRVTNQLQLRKPLAITEWGIDRTVYDLNSQARGDLMYQTLATAQELGISLIGIYSYDDRYGGIWRGGWDLTDAAQDPRIYDNTTAARVNAAVAELGRLLGR